MTLYRRTKQRQGVSPAAQRALWAIEAGEAPEAQTVAGFRFGVADARRLKVVSLNAYYGQVTEPDGTPSDPAIDVGEYAAVFDMGADVVALQEAVLTPLPSKSALANTAKSYAARDKAGSDQWARWTERFPEKLFRNWWSGLKAVAKAKGYAAMPPRGCGDSASMYRQRFGNAIFVHKERIRALGLQTPAVLCVPELIGKAKLRDYAGETEDRNAIVVGLGPLVLINTHLSEKATVSKKTGHTTQRDMMESVLKYQGDRTIIVGDFNKSDPETVPRNAASMYAVAYDAEKDRDLYDLLRAEGYAFLPNDRATAWNARHPDQVCSNFMDARELRKAVKILMPWNGSKVISDHAALAFSVSLR